MTAAPSIVLLQAAQGESDMSFFFMMGAIFLVFYLLVMRPQSKKQRERDDMIKNAVKGDRIVTNGGIHGVVTGVSDEALTVEIARVKGGARVEVKVARSGVSSLTKVSKSEGGDES
jgi:preprotein translocase subunit YajC